MEYTLTKFLYLANHMNLFTTQSNRDFTDDIIYRDSLLDSAVSWIQTNLTPDEVFTFQELQDWALNNGFELKE